MVWTPLDNIRQVLGSGVDWQSSYEQTISHPVTSDAESYRYHRILLSVQLVYVWGELKQRYHDKDILYFS